MTNVLVDDHAKVDALLRGLIRALDSGDAQEVVFRLDYVWARLAVHIRAEHLELFPALLAAAEAAAGTPGAPTPREVHEAVGRLREDHNFFMRELAEAVNGARALAAEGGSRDAGRLEALKGRILAVANRLAEHNQVEEGQVYLWPELLLEEESRTRLYAETRREIENLPPRFKEGGPGTDSF